MWKRALLSTICAVTLSFVAAPHVALGYDGLQADFATCTRGDASTQAKAMVDACSRLIRNAKTENETVGMFYAMRAAVNTDMQQNCSDARKAVSLIQTPNMRASAQDIEKFNCAAAPKADAGAVKQQAQPQQPRDIDGCIKGTGPAQVAACTRIIAQAPVEDESIGIIYAVRAAVNTDKAQNCRDARKALSLMKPTNRHYAGTQAIERNNCPAPRSNAEPSGGENKPQGVDYYSTLSCDQLWTERNGILARHGYCFQSQRAIAAFGKGCSPPYGKLPDNLSRVVNDIKGWEQRRGCG